MKQQSTVTTAAAGANNAADDVVGEMLQCSASCINAGINVRQNPATFSPL
ncbi:hypothetical protein Undi14_06265 [Undibacterium sp. 14-3-2]|nr:hypothetical protein [Undibacterium sp. 14-3-2]MBK1889633.1 hypothetical protein [Undibacterium sp. 14-3-2]